MNPKEFRIGNLCQDQHGNLLRVSNLANTEISFHVVDRKKYPLQRGWQAEPIPLTREWLDKLGMVSPGALERYDLKHFVFKSYSRFVLLTHREEPQGMTEITLHYRHGDKEIKYVHQLQNLYFALTGEELQIKDV